MDGIYEITIECANDIERARDHEDWDFWEAMADFCTIRDLIAAQRNDKDVNHGK